MFPFDFSSQNSCDNSAIFGGIMVVFGVALEAVDLFEKVKNRNKSILTKESMTLLWIEFFSISFVVLGLWLEIFATHKSSVFARAKSDELTSELKTAIESIGLQSTNIGQLRELNKELKKQISEAEEKLLSVSNEVALNSPSNFPISSIIGHGYMVINKSDASLVVGLKNKRVVLELMSQPPTNSLFRNPIFFGGVLVEGVISGDVTNRFGNSEVSFDFMGSNITQAGGGPKITFNNVAFVRVDTCPNGQTTQVLVVEGGFLSLELNSEFEFSAEFEFPKQTNGIQSIWGIRNKDQFK